MTRFLMSAALSLVILAGMQIAAPAGEQGGGKPCPIMEQQKRCQAEMEQMKMNYKKQFDGKNMSPQQMQAAQQQWEQMKQSKMSQCKAKTEQMKQAYYGKKTY